MTAIAAGAEGFGGAEGAFGGGVGAARDRNLPPGWAMATLGELGAWYGGGTPSKRNPDFWTDGSIPWLSPKDMGEPILSGTQDLIHESALGASPVKLLPAGAVAIVVRSGILERKVPVTYVPFEVTLNQDMKAVAPHPDIDGRWLASAIASQEHRILTDCRKQGTTVASLEVSRLMSVEIPVPPLAEQRRIVTKLDEQLTHVETGEKALEAAVELRRSLKDSLLNLHVLGRREEPDPESLKDITQRTSSKFAYRDLPPLPHQWEWRTAKEICPLITSGATPEASHMHSGSGDVPFLKVYNITKEGEVDFTIRPTFVGWEIHEGKLKKSRILPGDVLTNIVGPPLGKSAVVPKTHAEWNINQAIVAFRAGPEISPDWLRFVLLSPYVINLLVATARATAGQFNIALSTCRELPIPVPPMHIQNQLCDYLGNELSRLDLLNREVDVIAAMPTDLRATLLHAAFTGTLVPQDPTDEPASVLLARVRGEREAAGGTGPKRRASRPRRRATPAPRSPRPDHPGDSGQEELPL